MKKTELEQSVREIHFRLSKLSERIQQLEDGGFPENVHEFPGQDGSETYRSIEEQIAQSRDRICALEQRVQDLSDELYAYTDRQNRKIIQHIDQTGTDLGNRIQCLSDGIYEHVETQLRLRDQKREQDHRDKSQEEWMVRFGYDTLLSELQLSHMETVVPGNRKRLADLKDTHVGETCFVIGNGPSLKASDLDRIKQAGIFSFASNGIYKIFGQTQWRPDVWGVSDLDFIQRKKDEIAPLDGFVKLACAQAFLNKGILLEHTIYYPFIRSIRSPRFFNRDIMQGVHFYQTVTCKLINFAVYMGFTDIYLLGCDHSYPLKINADGKKVIDTAKQTHFSTDYYKNTKEAQAVNQHIQDMDQAMQFAVQSYKDMKYFCDQLGVSVHNATRGGKLEVFPGIQMEELFAAHFRD